MKKKLTLIKELIKIIGDDPERDGLIETPQRVLKSYVELFNGYSIDPREVLKKTFEVNNAGMVVVRDINFYSFCEHHLLPFRGKIHIGYNPKGRVVGLSKLVRLVNIFSRRLQIQERLTEQIAHTIYEELETEGCGVIVKARHDCMILRGVKSHDSLAVTSCFLGNFQDQQIKNLFLEKVNNESL